MFRVGKTTLKFFGSRTYSAVNEFDVVIVGGGAGGLSLLNNWKKHKTAGVRYEDNREFTFALVEPSEDHYYQPGWTLVGGGKLAAKESKKQTKNFIPNGATWYKEEATSIDANNSKVKLSSGNTVSIKTSVFIIL